MSPWTIAAAYALACWTFEAAKLWVHFEDFLVAEELANQELEWGEMPTPRPVAIGLIIALAPFTLPAETLLDLGGRR